MTMLSLTDLDRLLSAMRATGTSELEIALAGDHLRLVLPPEPAAAALPAMTPPLVARSPAIGHWQARGAGDGLPSLVLGEQVLAGEPLGYVQCGPLRWVVAAPGAGEIIATGPDNGSLVGHGDPVVQLRGIA